MKTLIKDKPRIVPVTDPDEIRSIERNSLDDILGGSKAMSYDVCEHGSLRRKCPLCDDAKDIAELEAEIERLTLDGIHTCHDQCQRIACVQRRKIERLRAALERAERVNAMVGALAVTTDELRRIRNAGKITFDKMVNAITTCLIDMREASASSAEQERAND